jgi:hypothetical protein
MVSEQCQSQILSTHEHQPGVVAAPAEKDKGQKATL